MNDQCADSRPSRATSGCCASVDSVAIDMNASITRLGLNRVARSAEGTFTENANKMDYDRPFIEIILIIVFYLSLHSGRRSIQLAQFY